MYLIVVKLHNTRPTDMFQKIFAIFSFHQKQNGKMRSEICWVASAHSVNGSSSVSLKASQKKKITERIPALGAATSKKGMTVT